MRTYLKRLQQLGFRLAIILAVFTICRLLFLIFNFSSFKENSFFEFLWIFIVGIRLDYLSVIYCNSLFILLFLIPFNFVNSKIYRFFLNGIFYIVNFILILANLVDLEYFRYTAKRTSADVFGFITMSDDTAMLLPQFVKDFWYIGVILIILAIACIWAVKRYCNIAEKYIMKFKTRIAAFGIMFGLFFILVVTARGFGLKPFSITTAARYTKLQNLPLLLNTPFNIIYTAGLQKVQKVEFFSEEELIKIYSPDQKIIGNKQKRTDNIMIIILESFDFAHTGACKKGKSYTPFLDSIADKGLVFTYAFANGKRSIDALPAILAGIPAIMNNSYIGSLYTGNRIKALPSMLKEEGYHTSFFHGARNGSMGFDDFSKIAGIDHYYGLDEYIGPEAYDGNWGIYDEEFLQYYSRQLKSFPKPFLTVVYTLSSHHPFTLPDKYNKLFKNYPVGYPRTVHYTDNALKLFFDSISVQPWFNNTLFIFVSDHTSSEMNGQVDLFRIPMIFYHPSDTIFHGISESLVQQSDIMPSVLDYLGIQKPFMAFGKSIFSDSPSFTVNYLNEIYQLITDTTLLEFDGEKSLNYYKINKNSDTLLKEQNNYLQKEAEEKLIKAYIQQFNMRLITNKLYFN